MSYPEFWIIAGPNGAGKTTGVSREPISLILPDVAFLNPDARTLLKLQAHGYQGFADAPIDVQTRLFFESADEVFEDLRKAISEGGVVGVETVLSSLKYRSLVDEVLSREGFVRLIYVALSSPSLAMSRPKYLDSYFHGNNGTAAVGSANNAQGISSYLRVLGSANLEVHLGATISGFDGVGIEFRGKSIARSHTQLDVARKFAADLFDAYLNVYGGCLFREVKGLWCSRQSKFDRFGNGVDGGSKIKSHDGAKNPDQHGKNFLAFVESFPKIWGVGLNCRDG